MILYSNDGTFNSIDVQECDVKMQLKIYMELTDIAINSMNHKRDTLRRDEEDTTTISKALRRQKQLKGLIAKRMAVVKRDIKVERNQFEKEFWKALCKKMDPNRFEKHYQELSDQLIQNGLSIKKIKHVDV